MGRNVRVGSRRQAQLTRGTQWLHDFLTLPISGHCCKVPDLTRSVRSAIPSAEIREVSQLSRTSAVKMTYVYVYNLLWTCVLVPAAKELERTVVVVANVTHGLVTFPDALAGKNQRILRQGSCFEIEATETRF